ncbi:hypothetical protein HC251_15930 [Iamia sp. SCSIO 61187]|uniref:hypothetical protein n=1 Tax=Iamia sp. SCSIO 61187 TaxID=2722752 RepID=UPI001C625B97|nr:hypothetical protein [Iamia sp. SCSIO 61187]QYG93766.1 hypothetical protein HC251_15930 [Iamia sp. SCSIO 61187]
MGLFDSIRGFTGGVDSDLVSRGIPARGLIVGVDVNGAGVAFGPDQYRVCDLAVQVFMDGGQPYVTRCRQRVHEVVLPQLGGGVAVAVRVDPQDGSRIAVVFGEDPPVVTMGPSPDGGAAAILATGTPAEAVVVANAPLGVRNHEGHDVHVFTLTVIPMDGQPYQVQVGNPFPAAALPLVFPGAKVPVKVGAAGPHDVAIDWVAAQGPDLTKQ